MIIQLPVLQNTAWDPAAFNGSGWVLCWRGKFTALQQFPWCVTENTCTALHMPMTVATSDLFTFFSSFQIIYACVVFVVLLVVVLFHFFPHSICIFLQQEFCNPNNCSSLQLCKLRPNSVLGFIKSSVVNSGEFLGSSMMWCFSAKLLHLKRAAHMRIWVFIF